MTSEIKEDVDYEVSDSVLAKVVKMAALEVPGVVAARFDIRCDM